MGKNIEKEGKLSISDDTLQQLARMICPVIKAYYNSEEGKKDFEEWKAQKAQKSNN